LARKPLARGTGGRIHGVDLGNAQSEDSGAWPKTSRPRISVVIPAHDEEHTIDRCLTRLLAGPGAEELQVVVVCNGCRDGTAQRARAYSSGGVLVLETQVRGKAQALNLGDSVAEHFPRFYVDADVSVTTEAIRDVARLLGEDEGILLAAPRAVLDYTGLDWLARSYFRVWTSLPYFEGGVIGSGIYAFSSAGRARFGEFPEIIADDEFARLQVGPSERRASSTSTFSISPPRSLREILRVQARVRAGNCELHRLFPNLRANDETSPLRSLAVILLRPRLWPLAPIYLAVRTLAAVMGRWKLHDAARRLEWERDHSSREAFH